MVNLKTRISSSCKHENFKSIILASLKIYFDVQNKCLQMSENIYLRMVRWRLRGFLFDDHFRDFTISWLNGSSLRVSNTYNTKKIMNFNES